MHLWGANGGPKIWSIITDDGKEYQDNSNCFFIRNYYREPIGTAMTNVERKSNPLSISGKFPGKT
jgi:hypothetical protein